MRRGLSAPGDCAENGDGMYHSVTPFSRGKGTRISVIIFFTVIFIEIDKIDFFFRILKMCIHCIACKIILKKLLPTEIVLTFNVFGRVFENRSDI